MKIVRLILLAALLIPVSAPAAHRTEIPAHVSLKNQSGIVEVMLTGKRKQTIHARPKDAATGSITFQADDIKRIIVYLPEGPLLRAEALAEAGRGQDALKMMRAIVWPLITYLSLPIEGAVDPALRYAALARKEKAWSEAIKVYRAMRDNPDAAISDQGLGWLAYCYMKNLQPGEAQKCIEKFEQEDPRSPGFVPAVLAESMLLVSENNDEAALDLAARAASLARIDHELYAEAMYMSAEAYYRMSKKEFDVTGEEGVALRKNTDVEEPMPPMLPEEFLAVATNEFARVITLFASSPYSIMASNTLTKIEEERIAEAENLKPTGNGE